jgi:hypothetical protein
MFAIEPIAFAQIVTLDRNGDATVQENRDRWTKICAVLATSLALARAVGGWFWFEKPWMGVKQNGDKVIQMGTYRSLDACRKGCSEIGWQLARQGLQELRAGFNR